MKMSNQYLLKLSVHLTMSACFLLRPRNCRFLQTTRGDNFRQLMVESVEIFVHINTTIKYSYLVVFTDLHIGKESQFVCLFFFFITTFLLCLRHFPSLYTDDLHHKTLQA